MSALDQKQTSRSEIVMSASSPKAEIVPPQQFESHIQRRTLAT
jgi:hypothetical protein